jgi:hypothetical protein
MRFPGCQKGFFADVFCNIFLISLGIAGKTVKVDVHNSLNALPKPGLA